MRQKNFDDAIKKKLSAHESPVNARVWENLSGQLPKKKRRPVLPILIFMTLALAAITIFLTNDLESSDHSKSDHDEIRENQPLSTASNDETASSNAVDIQENNTSNSEQNQFTADNNTDITQQNVQGTNQINAESNSKIKSLSSIELNASVQNVKKKIEDHENLQSIANVSSTTSGTLLKNITQEKNNEKNNISIEATDDLKLTSDVSSLSKGNIETNKEINNQYARDFYSINSLGLLDEIGELDIINVDYNPCSVKGLKKKERVHCFSFITQTERVFIDFVAGPQYAHKILRNKTVEGERDLLSDRKETESYGFAYNASARVGVKLPSGLTFMTGLSLDRYSERFKYYDPNAERTVVTHVIRDTFYDPVADSLTYVWEPISTTEQGARNVRHRNNMTFLSIPVLAGLTWEMGKTDFTIHGGVAFNLLFNQSGRIISEEGAVSQVEQQSIYKSGAGLGLIGGMILEQNLNDGWSIIAEPRFNYQMSSLTTENYPLEQNYLNIGVNFGIRKTIAQRTINKKKYGTY